MRYVSSIIRLCAVLFVLLLGFTLEAQAQVIGDLEVEGNVGVNRTSPLAGLHVKKDGVIILGEDASGTMKLRLEAAGATSTAVAGFNHIWANVGLNVRSGDTWIISAEKLDGTAIFEVLQNSVLVSGDFTVMNGTKNFQIDHPLDPANKKLRHNAVEGPDYITFYQGRVTLDANGEAVAELPAYFEALNKDVHYQLTCVGGYAQVYVADEVKDNRFRIAGGKPGLIVSWQITAVRNDPYAARHPYVVEINKKPEERGRFLYPEGYGLPASMRIGTVGKEPIQERPAQSSGGDND